MALGGLLVLVSAWAFANSGLRGVISSGHSGESALQNRKADSATCCQHASSSCCQQEETFCCCGNADHVCPQGTVPIALQKKSQKEEMKASAEAMAKGKAARQAVEAHRKALDKDGVHSCCINPSCVFCAAAGDMCPCAMNLRKGMPVCPECWGGWQSGFGRLEGVDAAKVQIAPKDKLKMMYEMKAKNFQKTQDAGK
ncbi:MAG: hypothetical protein L0Y70_17320 [Gemmataceae bacterium]|nr:hypothetical protein [Gemmataceae bacterium]